MKKPYFLVAKMFAKKEKAFPGTCSEKAFSFLKTAHGCGTISAHFTGPNSNSSNTCCNKTGWYGWRNASLIWLKYAAKVNGYFIRCNNRWKKVSI
ncbi:MAG: hypothetical protein HY842_10485 [Bacteroidetes bacterium]|nr:hypothetical protein [Bacteroidota bacterium]